MGGIVISCHAEMNLNLDHDLRRTNMHLVNMESLTKDSSDACSLQSLVVQLNVVYSFLVSDRDFGRDAKKDQDVKTRKLCSGSAVRAQTWGWDRGLNPWSATNFLCDFKPVTWVKIYKCTWVSKNPVDFKGIQSPVDFGGSLLCLCSVCQNQSLAIISVAR